MEIVNKNAVATLNSERKVDDFFAPNLPRKENPNPPSTKHNSRGTGVHPTGQDSADPRNHPGTNGASNSARDNAGKPGETGELSLIHI